MAVEYSGHGSAGQSRREHLLRNSHSEVEGNAQVPRRRRVDRNVGRRERCARRLRYPSLKASTRGKHFQATFEAFIQAHVRLRIENLIEGHRLGRTLLVLEDVAASSSLKMWPPFRP